MNFILSKILWMFFSPGNCLILLLLAASYLSLATHAKWQSFGRVLTFEIAFLLFFIAIFPVGDWMLQPLEDRFPPVLPPHVDGIVIIGSDENPRVSEARNQASGRTSATFFVQAARLARKYPQAKVMFAGGWSFMMPRTEKIDEADVAKQALLDLGISEDRLMFEHTSRNTHENAVNAAAIAHPTPQQNWLLVTSAFHMPRSIACFRAAGWNIYPSPTDYFTDGSSSSPIRFDLSDHLDGMATAAHEYYGLLIYWLVGYIHSPWPA